MDREHAIARLAFLVAPGNLAGLEEFVRANVPQPLPPEVAYEIVLQSYLFFGYPQAIEALRIFSETLRSLGQSLNADDGDVPSELIRRRGEELCRKIYHPNYEQLIENMKGISTELAEWMVTEGYGRVLSRFGPVGIEREIASIVFLSVSGHPVQLFSHVRGARNLGVDATRLQNAVSSAGLKRSQLELAQSTISRVFSG